MTEWEERYRTGDTPWDRGAASPGLVDFLAVEPVRGTVLVPGCGLGFDVRALATTADRVVGLDIAQSAVRGARKFESIGGEEYVQGDLFTLPQRLTGIFDWVFEHTCFCAIDPGRRPDYVSSVAQALKPDGRLLAVFYLDPEAGEGPPFPTTPAELDALFGGSFVPLQIWRPAHTYPGREGREIMRVLQRRAGE